MTPEQVLLIWDEQPTKVTKSDKKDLPNGADILWEYRDTDMLERSLKLFMPGQNAFNLYFKNNILIKIEYFFTDYL